MESTDQEKIKISEGIRRRNPLDSGLHSRVYAFVMASFQDSEQTTFQIGELSRRTALSIDAIRFYERRQLLPQACRSTGRFRLYTAHDIERLRFVRRMQRLGFSLKEVRELLSIRADRAHACPSVRRFLKSKLTEVTVKIRELQELEAELKGDLSKCARALKQQRGKACACPVLEEGEGTKTA